jgi:hypothetical protein
VGVAAALAGIVIAETPFTQSTFATYVPVILVGVAACYPRLAKMRTEMVRHSNREYLTEWWKHR